MQMDVGQRLRDEWAAKGSPPCSHPRLEKEYWQGSDTGDKVCDTCGELFYPGKKQPGES
ncbi:hypothetical protein ACIPIC_02435 [Streptomyces collinus]|uniref:hypothetical protein n=1 Tax=Streptomyces collinus TaxID=42684 RepID=UPI00382406F2